MIRGTTPMHVFTHSLDPSDFELATSKNIVIELLTDNYVEDKRLSAITDTGVILKSPNGTRFKLTVNDDGTLQTASV